MRRARRRGAGDRCECRALLTDLDGFDSHLMGIFYRTIRMVENGIKPAYVFDGKPPTMKSGEVGCQRVGMKCQDT